MLLLYTTSNVARTAKRIAPANNKYVDNGIELRLKHLMFIHIWFILSFALSSKYIITAHLSTISDVGYWAKSCLFVWSGVVLMMYLSSLSSPAKKNPTG